MRLAPLALPLAFTLMMPLVACCDDAARTYDTSDTTSSADTTPADTTPADTTPADTTPDPDTTVPVVTVPDGVADPAAQIAGKTYGEWADAWIQWYFSVPWSLHPSAQLDGWRCEQNQTADAFFMVSGFGTTSCNVPDNKPIVVPVLNAFWDNCGLDSYQIAIDADQARRFATTSIDVTHGLEVVLDRQTLLDAEDGTQVGAFRVGLRKTDFTNPDTEDNVIFATQGNPYTGVCRDTYHDGVYVILEPLAPGHHDLVIRARIDDPSLVGDTPYIVETYYDLVVAPPVAPADPSVAHHGKTNADWAGTWWGWFFGLPATGHPVLDETGADCAAGQSGDVFFLTGNFGGATERDCAVPAGKALFFPLLNYQADNGGVPEADWLSEADLRASAAAAIDGVDDLMLQIDGARYSRDDLASERIGVITFPYTLPAEDSLYELFGLPPEPAPITSYGDGYYVMLEALSPGMHHVRFTGHIDGGTPDDPSDDFALDVTYHLNVGP